MKRSLVKSWLRRLAPAFALLVLLPFHAPLHANGGGTAKTEGGDTPTNVSGIIGRAAGGNRTQHGKGSGSGSSSGG